MTDEARKLSPTLFPRDADAFERARRNTNNHSFLRTVTRLGGSEPIHQSNAPKVQAKWATSRANALQLRPVECDAMADPRRRDCKPRFYDERLGDVTVKPETVCLKKGSVRQGSKQMYREIVRTMRRDR